MLEEIVGSVHLFSKGCTGAESVDTRKLGSNIGCCAGGSLRLPFWIGHSVAIFWGAGLLCVGCEPLSEGTDAY